MGGDHDNCGKKVSSGDKGGLVNQHQGRRVGQQKLPRLECGSNDECIILVDKKKFMSKDEGKNCKGRFNQRGNKSFKYDYPATVYNSEI